MTCRDALGIAHLDEGESGVYRTTVYGGNEYLIIGAGDEGIEDLDLSMFDEDFAHVASDTQTDAVPLLNVAVRGGAQSAYVRATAFSGSGHAVVVVCYRRR